MSCTLVLKGPFLTRERLTEVYSRVKAGSSPVHFYGKEGEARVMYSSMAELQRGLELTQKTDSFGGGRALGVEILQWHSNNHFFGEYLDDAHFERELRELNENAKAEASPARDADFPGPPRVIEMNWEAPREAERGSANKDTAKETLEKKMSLKKRKQQLQRSMDIWETRQGEEDAPEEILKPISAPKPRTREAVPVIQLMPVEAGEAAQEGTAEALPLLKLDLVPVAGGLSERPRDAAAGEGGAAAERAKARRKKLTFFNSEEEEKQRDNFVESKDAFERHLDALAGAAEDPREFSRCRRCRVDFKSALELSVHFAFDNAHKMDLQRRLECVEARKL